MAGPNTWIRGLSWSLADQSPQQVAALRGALDLPFALCPRPVDTRDRRGLPRYLARRHRDSAER